MGCGKKQGKNSTRNAEKCLAEDVTLFGIYQGNIAHMSLGKKLLVLLLALISGYLHSWHVGTLFENDRHFSHLSTLEREMSFTTEMGLYYSYFKTITEAPTFIEGVHNLYANNITEYPDTINVLKRFNLYPEIFLGAAYRCYTQFADQMNWKIKRCWQINRGDDLPPVLSCEGLGDPHIFYINGVWVISSLTTFFMFLLSVELSNSILGGVFAILCFFFNHGECTRVQWTPPLRESFAYPVWMAQTFFITLTLRANLESKHKRKQEIIIGFLSSMCILMWQFSQFAMLTQFFSIFLLYVAKVIPKASFQRVQNGHLIALVISSLFMFGNEMLLTSWLFLALITSKILLLIPLDMIEKLPKLIGSALVFISFCVITLFLKLMCSNILSIKDDAHVSDILKSKFTDFETFDTLLYTCAKEFDFLDLENPYKMTCTLALPCAIVIGSFILWRGVQSIAVVFNLMPNLPSDINEADPSTLYHIIQTVCYVLMAVIIMRLKLFMGPQICIVASLIASEKILTRVIPKRENQIAFVCLIAAVAAVQGSINLKKQHSILGEFQNAPMEHMIDWINLNIPPKKSIAGPMNLMANVLLSTRRPVVNHPHYEDEGLRGRTKIIYKMYSKTSVVAYHQELVNLQADYLLIPDGPCLRYGHQRDKCGLKDIWDRVEPENVNKPDLCPILFESPNPEPFKKVFANTQYVILKI